MCGFTLVPEVRVTRKRVDRVEHGGRAWRGRVRVFSNTSSEACSCVLLLSWRLLLLTHLRIISYSWYISITNKK